MFATTSGTTGAAKYIPVTPSYLAGVRATAIHVHTYRLLADFPDILEGQVAGLVEQRRGGAHRRAASPYGAISGYLTRTQPAFIRRFYVLPYEICRVKTGRGEVLPDPAPRPARRRALPGRRPNPSSLLLLAEKMTDARRRAHRRHPHAARSIRATCRPTPRRGSPPVCRPTPGARTSWPPASGAPGGSSRPTSGRTCGCQLLEGRHDAALPAAAARVLRRRARSATSATWPARGGARRRWSTPARPACSTSPATSSSSCPKSSATTPDPEFLTCDQLEANREYYVYFTTSAGLYRYDINDLVRVVDFYRDTPVIQFVRKGQGIISITGEKLTESQVTAALLDVVERGRLRRRPRHRLRRVGRAAVLRLVRRDGGRVAGGAAAPLPASRRPRAVGAQHRVRGQARRRSGWAARSSRRVARAPYQALRQRRVAEGAPEAQVKIPHLSTNMRFGEQLPVVGEYRVEPAEARW